MKQHYPDGSVQTADLYDTKVGGPFVKLYEQPDYQNTCAVRMSYGLNRSGLKLARAPSAGGSLRGGDGYWYWIRVSDLKRELARRFKGADEELSLTVIPSSLIHNKEAMSNLYNTRVEEAQAFIDTRLCGRNGIVVFEVSGWDNASGHFTLWEGSTKTLAYADRHDKCDNNAYYFWLTNLIQVGEKSSLIQVVNVKFWELK